MREFPPPDQLLRPRDAEPLIVVPPQTWHCMFCDPRGGRGATTTVEWIGACGDGPDGRCRECGQKYALAPAAGLLLREMVRPRPVDARLDHCEFCEPTPTPGSRPTVAWRGQRGRCAHCGQAYMRPAPEVARAA